MTDTWNKESYDAEGLDVDKEFEPLPRGRYDLQIDEAAPSVSKNGFKMVTITAHVIDSLAHNGRQIKFHNVTFLPKANSGAFLALRFLKAINQPYQGKFAITPADWVNQRFSAMVGIEDYETKKGSKGQKNVIDSISVKPYEGAAPAVAPVDEEIPF